MRADGEKFQHYIFSRHHAARALNFISKYCRLSEGQYAGQRIKLSRAQVAWISEIFGWINPTSGFRRYRKAFLFLPRKNGKSTLIAGIALYMLMADGEKGAQVILASNSKDQSSIVFNPAAAMVDQSPKLKEECDVRKARLRINHPSSRSYLRVIPADAKNVLGLNISCLIYDEIAFAPNRDLYDALTSSSGTRQQPLQLFITTAGKEQQSIGYELYTYAKNVLADPKFDPTFYAAIYEVPTDADWTDEKEWFKANPALGQFKLIEDMRAEFKEAMSSTAAQTKFLMFQCNRWVQAVDSWLDVEKWKLCGDPDFNESVLKDYPCWLALDMSKTTDLTALVAIWRLPDNRYYIRPTFFIPGEDLNARVLRDHAPYDAWEEDGWINVNPGPEIDYAFVRKQLDELKDNNRIQQVAYDDWNAKQFAQELEKDGFPMVKVVPGHQSLAIPSKEFETLIIAKKLLHDANPCMQWQVGNVAVRFDANANIIPDKKHAHHRMDGIQATIMALSCAMRVPEVVKKPAEFRVHVLG